MTFGKHLNNCLSHIVGWLVAFSIILGFQLNSTTQDFPLNGFPFIFTSNRLISPQSDLRIIRIIQTNTIYPRHTTIVLPLLKNVLLLSTLMYLTLMLITKIKQGTLWTKFYTVQWAKDYVFLSFSLIII